MGLGDDKNSDSGSGRTKDFLDIVPDPIGPHDPAEMSERNKSQGRPKAIIAGVLIGVAVAGGVGWLVLDGLSNPKGDASVPTLIADKKPAKVRPDAPGGMEIPNRDKLVYEKLARNGSKTETLTPPPYATAPSAPARISATPKIPELPKVDSRPPPPAQVALPKVVRLPTPNLAPNLAPGPKVAATPKPVQAPKPAPIKPAAAPTPAKRLAQDAKDATSGTYLIQILAARDAARAETQWGRLAKKNDDLLGGKSHLLVRADLGAKGIYYRLRVGPFSDKASASAFCKSLKARKVGCMIVRNK